MTYHHAAMTIDHRVPYMEAFGPPASAQPRYMTGGKPAAGCVGRRFEWLGLGQAMDETL